MDGFIELSMERTFSSVQDPPIRPDESFLSVFLGTCLWNKRSVAPGFQRPLTSQGLHVVTAFQEFPYRSFQEFYKGCCLVPE